MQHRPGWIPRNERIEIQIDAVLHRSDDSMLPVRLVNISFEGCELTAAGTFAVGERVRIHIDGQGYIEAEMRWSFDGCSGAKFLSECNV